MTVATPIRVLIVEDSSDDAELVCLELKDGGYDVTSKRVDTAQGMTQALENGTWDVVISDYVMPRFDGRAALDTLKTSGLDIPFVMVSGKIGEDVAVEAMKAGASDYLLKDNLFTMARALEERDRPTQGHCERLSTFGSALGQRLGLPDSHVNALRQAGVVHDIGKISVPDRILLKDGPLTLDERAVMELHPITGEQICQSLKSFRLVLPIIRHHHEKLDGSGYPDGLSGEEIPLTARVLQIVDVYDALTSERSYRPALLVEEALQTLAEEVKRGWWDPDVFAEFRSLSSNGLPSLE